MSNNVFILILGGISLKKKKTGEYFNFSNFFENGELWQH
jgi:hypothetical protein